MKYLQMAAAALLLTMGACQKDQSTDPTITSNTTPTQTKTKQLVSINYSGLNTSGVKYEYDSKGRIIKVDEGEDVATFVYTGNEVEISEWRVTENREVFKFKGKFNAAGNLVDGTATSNYNQAFVYKQQHTYEYTADGYLSKAAIARDNGDRYEYIYHYKGGHLAQQDVHRNGVLDYAFYWEYGTGNPNKTGFNVYAFVPGNNFLGKKATEMAIKYTLKRPGVNDQVSTFSYTVDAQGYATKQHVTDAQGKKYDVLYEYK